MPIGQPYLKLFSYSEVTGLSPTNYINFNHYLGDTWQPLFGPHVTNPFATMPRVKKWFVHTTVNQHLPCVTRPFQINICHVSYGPATSASIRTVWTVQSTHFFYLFDDLNRTRYLTHPMSVWTQTSCVGFVTMRNTHPFVLRTFQELWFLS